MTLEELILKRLSEDRQLTAGLASYAGRPAVFHQLAPDDRQDGWQGACQYPRAVYAVDMQANQERKSAGTLEVSLLCDEAGLAPEGIEPLLRGCMKDVLITPDSASPYCFSWARTDSFDMPSRESGADTRVLGAEVRFDILEYTSQETTDPDPVAALNRCLKRMAPEAFILGLDHMGHIKVADAKEPAIYCRLMTAERGQVTNTVAWMDGRIAVHVLCPSADIRLKMVMEAANALSLAGEVAMLDGSPMRILRLQVDHGADYLKDGQLYVTFRYGVLRYRDRPHMVDGAGISYAD